MWPPPSLRPAPRPPTPPTSAPARAPAPPVAPPPRTRATAGELVERWQLLGPRGFAIVGGAVTALGIGLLFVLAANRGWIGPAERVLIGAVASALVFGAGLAVRARYGQLHAALAAVGAGAAGAYATLAAATARYDLVPDALALPLAGLIAALTTAVALAWGSQILAGVGLVGSALAPALQAIDTGMTPASAAFAVIVLAATAVVAARRRWEPLLISVAAIVGVQTLVARRRPSTGRATLAAISVGLALAGVLLGAGKPAPPRSRGRRPRAVAGDACAGRSRSRASHRCAASRGLGPDRGVVLLAAGGVWAGVWLALQARDRSLAFLVGSSALALIAVATAHFSSDDALGARRGRRRRPCSRLSQDGSTTHACRSAGSSTSHSPPGTSSPSTRRRRCCSTRTSRMRGRRRPRGERARCARCRAHGARHHVPETETGVLAFLSGVAPPSSARAGCGSPLGVTAGAPPSSRPPCS